MEIIDILSFQPEQLWPATTCIVIKYAESRTESIMVMYPSTIAMVIMHDIKQSVTLANVMTRHTKFQMFYRDILHVLL